MTFVITATGPMEILIPTSGEFVIIGLIVLLTVAFAKQEQIDAALDRIFG